MMVTKAYIFQVILSLTLGVFSTELLPERYLKPEVFNHHPFTDVGIPATLKKALKSNNPYAILSKKRQREGREFPPQDAIFYPTPHPSVISRKYVESNEISKYDDPFVNVPKNYAFSYIVKDRQSGDDFSHSQAHNGKATRGQYRVKLPDGRIQIVSYTADHKGYRADVQYEEDTVSKPLPKALFHPLQNLPKASDQLSDFLQRGDQNHQTVYVPSQISPVSSRPSAEVVYTPTASPSDYHQSPTTASPVQYVADHTALNLLVKTTIAPHYFQPQYVTTTAAPFVQQQFVTSTANPQYIPQQVSSTPLYPVEHASVNTAVPHQQYQKYQAVSSNISPEQVIVTPRPVYNSAIKKDEKLAHVYYRLI